MSGAPPPPQRDWHLVWVPLAVLWAPASSAAGEGASWDARACSQAPATSSFPHCAPGPRSKPRLELLEAGTHSCVLAVRLFGRGQERNLGGAACVWRMTLPEPRSTDALLEAEAWPDWMARCWGCGPHRGPGGVSGDTEPATEPCSQFCLRLPVLPICAHVWGPITQPDP